jgi:hypothetical protein
MRVNGIGRSDLAEAGTILLEELCASATSTSTSGDLQEFWCENEFQGVRIVLDLQSVILQARQFLF